MVDIIHNGLGNVVTPHCAPEVTSCAFDCELMHRYTMVEYKGDDNLEIYDVSKLVAKEGKLYRESCDGIIETTPLNEEGEYHINIRN